MNQPPNPYPHQFNEPDDRERSLPDGSQPDSLEPDYIERMRIQQAREEAERLRQEERRIGAAQRRTLFARIVNSIYFLVGLLEVLLGLRFFLQLSGANPNNAFAQTIYGISDPFVAPFSPLFISSAEDAGAVAGKNIFDVNLLIAMAVYAILCGIGVWFTRYIQEQIGDPLL